MEGQLAQCKASSHRAFTKNRFSIRKYILVGSIYEGFI
jgi:hypothetical protein